MSEPEEEARLTSTRRFQIGLSNILLATAVAAIWIAYRHTLLESRELESRLPGLRSIARELVIRDPSKFAIIKRWPKKYGELVWDVYVPNQSLEDLQAGGTTLCVALDDLPKRVDWADPVQPLKAITLSPGKHSIELSYERIDGFTELVVLVDGKDEIQIIRNEYWEPGEGWASGGSPLFEMSKYDTLDRPLTMLYRRFLVTNGNGMKSVPNEPGPGILLWVQR